MTWNEKLQIIIDYIETCLQQKEEPIQEAYITQITQCSYTFFQKVFSYTTGISFAEYIRNRKMTLAGYDCKKNHMKVIDLSLTYGYDSPTSFTKAFRLFHGVTPKEARHASITLRVYPKMQVMKKSDKFTWRIEQKENIQMIGKIFPISKTDDMQTRIPSIWSMCQQDGSFAELLSYDQSEPKGICGLFIKQDTSYDYMMMVEHNTTVDGYKSYQLPSCTWVIFDCIGPIPQAIQSGWDFLHKEWLHQYPFQHAYCPEIEWYSCGNIYDKNYHSQIWIPIVEEEESNGTCRIL